MAIALVSSRKERAATSAKRSRADFLAIQRLLALHKRATCCGQNCACSARRLYVPREGAKRAKCGRHRDNRHRCVSERARAFVDLDASKKTTIFACLDNHKGSSASSAPHFSMSADEDAEDDIHIPALFVFYAEGQQLVKLAIGDYRVEVRLASLLMNPRFLLYELFSGFCCWRSPQLLEVSERAS